MAWYEPLITFPTVIFSALVGALLVYWLLVILGALDIDLIPGPDLDGDGVADALAHASDGGAEASFDGLSGIMTWMGFGKVPVTILMSILAVTAWAVCILGGNLAFSAIGDLLPSFVVATILFLIATFLGMVATSLIARPLAPIFKTHEADRRQDLVGKTCRVDTGSVDKIFGQATVDDRNQQAVIQVRNDHGHVFQRGDIALIVSWEERREAFLIEPLNKNGSN